MSRPGVKRRASLRLAPSCFPSVFLVLLTGALYELEKGFRGLSKGQEKGGPEVMSREDPKIEAFEAK